MTMFTEIEITRKVIMGRGRMGKKVQGIKNIKGRYKIDRGEVKNSMGNGQAKELIGMTHGHELRWGNDDGRGGYRVEGNTVEKKIGQL